MRKPTWTGQGSDRAEKFNSIQFGILETHEFIILLLFFRSDCGVKTNYGRYDERHKGIEVLGPGHLKVSLNANNIKPGKMFLLSPSLNILSLDGYIKIISTTIFWGKIDFQILF